MNQFPYREVVNAVEQRLIECGSARMEPVQIQLQLDKFKRFSERQPSDDEYFSESEDFGNWISSVSELRERLAISHIFL